jgi:predicted RNA-binding Zn-ribbon protein involved in translation (DUF1610 family)
MYKDAMGNTRCEKCNGIAKLWKTIEDKSHACTTCDVPLYGDRYDCLHCKHLGVIQHTVTEAVCSQCGNEEIITIKSERMSDDTLNIKRQSIITENIDMLSHQYNDDPYMAEFQSWESIVLEQARIGCCYYSSPEKAMEFYSQLLRQQNKETPETISRLSAVIDKYFDNNNAAEEDRASKQHYEMRGDDY